MKLEKKEIIKKDMGKRIEFIRTQNNMTKEKFAKLINISGQHLGKTIAGKKGLSIEKVIEISNITGYSTDFILKGVTNKSNLTDEKINDIKKYINNINDIINSL